MSELLKSGRVGNNETDEQILNAWKDSGLLDGLDENWKLHVAKALEKLAKHMLESPIKYNSTVDVLVFPAIRRICSEFIKFPENGEFDSFEVWYMAKLGDIIEMIETLDPEHIITKIDMAIYPTMGVIQTVFGENRYKVDIEAEALCVISELLANQHKANHRRNKKKLNNTED